MGMFDVFKPEREQPNVVATIPSAPTLYRFRALKNFWSDAFNSQYAANGIYSVRQGNPELATAVSHWVTQGKVEVL